MAEKPDDIVKQLLEEGKRKGSLTYTQINNLLEDQFLPPDRMDAVITALEDAGVELIDDPVNGILNRVISNIKLDIFGSHYFTICLF